MAKKVKSSRKAHLEETQPGKMSKSTTIPSMTRRLKPHRGEIIIYLCVILSLSVGTYWRNKVWNSEIELWTDSVKKSPNKGRPHYNLGTVLLEQGKYEEAIAHLTEALQIKPNYAEAHVNLGNALTQQGKYEEAMAHLTEALRIKPNYAEAHKKLGDEFARQGK
jgi:tetratricopeptide (TPR) repeat protein